MRPITLIPLTQSHEQQALAIDHDAAAEMQSAAHLGQLTKNYPYLFKRRLAQPRTSNRRARPAGAALRETKVDRAIRRKLAIKRHIQQAALPLRHHRRHAAKRRR